MIGTTVQAKVYCRFIGSSALSPKFRGKEVTITDIGTVAGVKVGTVVDKKYGRYPVVQENKKWVYIRR
jgi:hypothetical protein